MNIGGNKFGGYMPFIKREANANVKKLDNNSNEQKVSHDKFKDLEDLANRTFDRGTLNK